LTRRGKFRNCAALALLFAGVTTPIAAQPESPSRAKATLQGTVCDSKHQPISGAVVSLQSANGTELSRARADATGAFKFTSLAQGSYTVHAETATQGKATLAGIQLSAEETKSVTLTVSDPNLAFFDEPTFSVAGVTDTTNLGGHGSDAIVRTRNALAKETVGLTDSSPKSASAGSAEVEAKLRAAQTRDPDSFAANDGLAAFLISNGRTQDAKPYLARASAIAGSDPSINTKDKADLHRLLAGAAEQGGDPLQAAHEYQRAAELDPSEANIFDWGAELLLHHAPEPATEVFDHGHDFHPNSVRMLLGLGAAWYFRGSYDQATRRLCEASDAAPHDLAPYLFLGKILVTENGESPAVAERFQRFATLQPNNAMANYYYAVSLWKQRKGSDDNATADQAQALLEKAVTLDPRLAAAHLQLGIIQAERKDFRKAAASYRSAIELEPAMAAAHFRLAQAYRLGGQPDKASEEVKQYERLTKEQTAQVDRERSEVKRLVYTLRGTTAAPPAQPQ